MCSEPLDETMDPAGPPTNSETSINFDAQAQYDADEAEYRREEQERQAEVCYIYDFI